MTDAEARLLEPGTDPDATCLFLARLFWRASSPLVASLLLGGCVEHEGALVEQQTQELTGLSLHCPERSWRPMSALKLTQPVDFLALRSAASVPRPNFHQLDAAGVPCGSASDPRLCRAELARASLLEASGGSLHLALTRGDTVQVVQSLEQKLSLLGSIDTPDEALLIAQHHGFPVGCSVGGPASQVRVRDGGYRVFSQVPSGCQFQQSMADVDADGTFHEIVVRRVVGAPCPPPPPPPCCPGRRPANLQAQQLGRQSGSGLARYFARAARLEAASVPAFEQLAAELRVFGAPAELQAAARRAAEDEVRHAEATRALAEQHGARPELPRLGRQRLRSRAEVALDNAIEGCVNETYSAYVATAQARLAHGSGLVPVLQGIAVDETRHAALAFRLAAWLEPQLAPSVRRRIDTARSQALRQLGRA